MAELLDAHGIRWEYEPHLFVLEERPNGTCKSGFQPDFYLPDLDLYIEVTTVRSPTRKNRKIRELRELRPDVRVKLLRYPDVKGLLDAAGATDAAVL